MQGFGSASDDRVQKLIVQPTGEIYAVGYYAGTMTLPGNRTVAASGGALDGFVLRLNRAGGYIWHHTLGSASGALHIDSIALDPATGDMYLVGSFNDTVDFDPSAGEDLRTDPAVDWSMFITKYRLTGTSGTPQTIGPITFNPATVTVGGTTTVSATASSGLPVTFSAQTPTICTVNGSTVTGIAVGTCIVAADQPGDATYNPAPQVTGSLSVSSGASERVATIPGIAGVSGSARQFRILVPDGRSQLTVRTSGASGDVDLYVRRGAAATPATFDCRSITLGSNETCVIDAPVGGDYYLLLQASAAYADLTLSVSWPQP